METRQIRRPRVVHGDKGHGHDYRFRGEDGARRPDNIDRVHDMLAERLQDKFARDFKNADRILAELGRMGVSVEDNTKTWHVVAPAALKFRYCIRYTATLKPIFALDRLQTQMNYTLDRVRLQRACPLLPVPVPLPLPLPLPLPPPRKVLTLSQPPTSERGREGVQEGVREYGREVAAIGHFENPSGRGTWRTFSTVSR